MLNGTLMMTCFQRDFRPSDITILIGFRLRMQIRGSFRRSEALDVVLRMRRIFLVVLMRRFGIHVIRNQNSLWRRPYSIANMVE